MFRKVKYVKYNLETFVRNVLLRKENDMNEKESEYYCQQHVCSQINECMRSWKNMPRGTIFVTMVYSENKNGNCKYYTEELIQGVEKE